MLTGYITFGYSNVARPTFFGGSLETQTMATKNFSPGSTPTYQILNSRSWPPDTDSRHSKMLRVIFQAITLFVERNLGSTDPPATPSATQLNINGKILTLGILNFSCSFCFCFSHITLRRPVSYAWCLFLLRGYFFRLNCCTCFRFIWSISRRC